MQDKYLDLAEHFIEIKNSQRALEELTKVSNLSYKYYYLSARAYFGLQRYKEAKNAVHNGLIESPDNLSLLYFLVQTERRLQNYPEAEKHVIRLKELYPDRADVTELFAVVMLELKKPKLMRKAFLEAKQLRGEVQNDLLNATTASMYGKPKIAIQHIELALAQKPDDPLTNSIASNIFKKNYQYDKALKLAIIALRLEPSNSYHQEQVRILEVLTHPIMKPFSLVLKLNAKYSFKPLLGLIALFVLLFVTAMATKKDYLIGLALQFCLSPLILFAFYGAISFFVANIYFAIKRSFK